MLDSLKIVINNHSKNTGHGILTWGADPVWRDALCACATSADAEDATAMFELSMSYFKGKTAT